MKKLFFTIAFAIAISTQAQIHHYFYVDVEDEEKFEEVFEDYWLKVAQKAVDDGGIEGWSVWKKQRKTNSYKYLVLFNFKDMEQYTNDWGFDALKATGVPSKHIDFEWNIFRSDTYRVDSSVPGTYDFVVVNYSKPNDLNKQLKYEVEYITPIMNEIVANKFNGQTGWNVQHKIYPVGSEEKFTMFSVDGYASMADAIKSFDTEYGKDYYSGWNSIIKKVHGKKTMQQSLTNGFGYRPIYKRILRTN
jgi:hypothetical protein